jgi:type VI secretion system secreted protein VgrG
MAKKSGSAGQVVEPVAPDEPEDADSADPGEVAEVKSTQQQTQTGKYGATPVQPHQPNPEKTSWIEIEMVDEEDRPVPGEIYRVTLPDGSVAEGTLDENGFARIGGMDPGQCQITFPELDQEAWEKI